MNASVEIDGLRKRFGPVQALDGMTFTVGLDAQATIGVKGLHAQNEVICLSVPAAQ